MARINVELVKQFTATSIGIGTKMYEASTAEDAVQYVLDVCEAKAPCELLAEEPGTEKGPLSVNKVPTRLQRIIFAPSLDEKHYALLEAACKKKGYLCLRDGIRNYLAGIDIGIGQADLGVASTATCMINANHEETRIANLVCETSILFLRKSEIYTDLLAIAPQLRALHSQDTPAYTAFTTGPSRTADIERVLATGVHGPLEQHIILLED